MLLMLDTPYNRVYEKLGGWLVADAIPMGVSREEADPIREIAHEANSATNFECYLQHGVTNVILTDTLKVLLPGCHAGRTIAV